MKNLALFCSALAVSSCATTYNAGWEQPAAPSTASTSASETAQALAAQGDASWKMRDDVSKLKEATSQWEAAAAQWANGALYSKIARAHYFLADAHLAMESDEAARDAEYNRGLEWSTSALKLEAPEMVAALKAGDSMIAAVKKAPATASEALLWYASNLGKWAAAHRFATRVKYKDELKAIIDHVHETDPSQHGATNRWLGSYEAQTIGIAGGSAERSEAYFKKSLEVAPNYFGTKVLWAQFLCTKRRDRETYKRLLNEVIAADPSVDPGNIPENKADQMKAKQLLGTIDSMFSL
jgi:tetratricopeptide (TPR) repeat protein